MNTLHESVWQMLSIIPYGKVSTYGRVAKLIAYPQNARQVGQLISRLPVTTKLPWYRILNSQGKISMRPGSGPGQQRQLLEDEGVIFINDRVSLTQYGWPSPWI